MTNIIAFSNHKGGVAKTTSCISIGACLAESGHKVLLLDLDPQVNLTMTACIDPDHLEYTLVDLLDRGSESVIPSSMIHATALSGLDLLPADQRLIDYEMNAREYMGYEKRLSGVLDSFLPMYDYILIDCPPSMGSLTIMALTAATLAMIPVQCDYYSTRGLINLVEIINAVRKRTNPSLQYALFVTMYDSRPLISRRILDQLRTNFPDEMMETVISIDTRLRESAMANEPVITYASKTRASQQYRSLAEELILHIEKFQR